MALALLAAACGKNSNSKSAAKTTRTAAATSTSMHEEMMPLPDYAKGFKTTFAAPADGVKVTGNELKVEVAVSGFKLDCDLAGKDNTPTSAHYHLLLDKVLINMYCSPDATVSMQNIKPGVHKLEVAPALNDHAEVLEAGNAQTISFDYEPTSALPVLTDETSADKPSIKILSPKPGAVLSGAFDVVVEIKNFEDNCNLFGKPGVAGYGHWHANLDSMEGSMMGMGTMLGMACTNTFHATTTGLKSGQTHDVIALLVDNGHAPLHPAVADKVTVTIG
ncbi:MAG: hypothetical protein H0W70_03150 [Actinobacteria bacterium]|nr:hypothetical protein [Actinomycetota bacterium]